jgi:hypothetical protein
VKKKATDLMQVTKQGILHFNQQWERELTMRMLLDNENILKSVWTDVDIQEEKNPYYDPAFIPQKRSWDVRAFRHRLVVAAHPEPFKIDPALWVAGDHLVSVRPDKLLYHELQKHYYHPVVLSDRRLTYADLQEFRQVLWIPADEEGERPQAIIGPNPLKPFHQHGSIRVRNPQSPKAFPWAISLLCSAEMPKDRVIRTIGDNGKVKARKITKNEIRRRKSRGDDSWVTPTSLPDLVWEELNKAGALQDLTCPQPRKVLGQGSPE